MIKGGYLPDSISTDLHFESMNLGMKDILNVADKLLALGETIPRVFQQMTWNPAREIKQEQLGHLSPGAVADVSVFSVEHGKFGFIDTQNTRLMGDRKLICELTIHNGKVVYDLNGISTAMWNATQGSAAKAAH
jgi:dihydroorotase